MSPMFKKDLLVKLFFNSLYLLPCPANITLFWNFGSLLGVCLLGQIMSGLFLSMHYSNSMDLAFFSVSHIMRDVNLGWALRILHANGASLFFVFLYLHLSRGLYYESYWLKNTWMAGVSILILSMAAAFMGYVLPWGQMSFWGATVITNLFSAIPFIGGELVCWVWGGFAVDNATLNRFFSFHFLIPFMVLGLVLVHLMFLHVSGSSNPLGIDSNLDKVYFYPYFLYKDLMGMVFVGLLLLVLCLFFPWFLGDPENFISANPLVTPIHIQPEWYFLFAYAILRSIPNKLGGVLALFGSLLVLYVMPFMNFQMVKGFSFCPIMKLSIWFMSVVVILLTWIGARPVEAPYVLVGQVLTVVYFSYFMVVSYLKFFCFNSL